MFKIVSWRKTDYVAAVMQKSHQNIQHENAKIEEIVKYVKESIQQD